jgi:hypothetical protein
MQVMLRLSDKNLIKIVSDQPRLVPFFFEMLDIIISRRQNYTHYAEEGGLIHSFYYNSEQALDTKFRLLQVCKREMSFTKNDKELMLRNVIQRINNASTIAALTKISNEPGALIVIDYQRHQYIDKAINFFNKKPQYVGSKIRFIEALQKAAVTMSRSDAFAGSFSTASHYLSACQSILDLPFFADAHCEKGVSKEARNAMHERMTEIKAAIPNAPAPARSI